MIRKEKKYLNLSVGIITALLTMPLLLQPTTLFGGKWFWPLSGFQTDKKIEFSGVQDLFSQKFQDSLEQWLADKLLLKPWYLRFRNQIQYSAFDKFFSAKAVKVKENFLMEKDHIEAYVGSDKVDKSWLAKIISRLKKIELKLKSQGITLISVLAPSKASYYPELIPDHYFSDPAQRSAPDNNYKVILSFMRQVDLPYLDLLQYTRRIFVSNRLWVYPKYGTHWSVLAAHYNMAELIDYWNQNLSSKLPLFSFGSWRETRLPLYTDADIFKSFNLLWSQAWSSYVYPSVVMAGSADHKEAERPSVLFVGDSFYFTLLYTGVLEQIFSRQSEFWYYGKTRHFYDGRKPQEVKSCDFGGFSAIILLVSEVNFKWFGFGFIEKMSQCLGID